MTSRTAQRRTQATSTVARRSKPRDRTARRGTGPGRRTAYLAIGVAVVAAVVIVGVGLGRQPETTAPTSGADASEAIRLATNVPAAALDAASVGDVSPPVRLPDGIDPLSTDGKPVVVSIGAEYCPFCAAQRWPLVIALSRFGTFEGLGLTTSSPTDVFPDSPTFTFHGATYASPYVTLSAVETADRMGAPLETPTDEQMALLERFDVPPYTDSAGAIPFLLLGNRYVQVGSPFSPGALARMSQVEIARQLATADAGSPAGDILGSANVLTAAICELTGAEPANVCQSPGVQGAAGSLPTQPPG